MMISVPLHLMMRSKENLPVEKEAIQIILPLAINPKCRIQVSVSLLHSFPEVIIPQVVVPNPTRLNTLNSRLLSVIDYIVVFD